MVEDPAWLPTGPEKTALLKRFGFDIVGMHFVNRVNHRMLTFDHARDTPLASLRTELEDNPRAEPSSSLP